MDTIRCCHLFSGIEGFRYGLENASKRYQAVYSNDNDRWASAVSRYHYRDNTHHEGNIRTVNPSTIPEHDLLCAGFPCQSFSNAGKRRGFTDTRGTLFFEICRVLWAKQSDYVFLENIQEILWHDNFKTFYTILTSLSELGFNCQWQVLNSQCASIPQNRNRVFIIGTTRNKPFRQILPIFNTAGEGDCSYSQTTKEELWISTLPALYNKTLGQGPFIEEERRYRLLTPKEFERLQGFPDDWTKYGLTKEGKVIEISDKERYKCCGNAVTTNVITAIGNQLLESLHNFG